MANGIKSGTCGCRSSHFGITYCSTHAAAPRMHALLAALAKRGAQAWADNPEQQLAAFCIEARAILRDVEGGGNG